VTTELSRMKYEGLIGVVRKRELVIIDFESLRAYELP
jgi:hypothetical protein